MRGTIIHELPDRLRLNLQFPKRPFMGMSYVEGHLEGMGGVKKVSFNDRTNNLLVRYNGNPDVRDNILLALENIPLSFPKRKRPKPGPDAALERKKRAVINGGMLLMASPIIPLALKPFIALYGAMPILKKGAKNLFERRVNVDVLDSSAIGVAMTIRDYRTAGVISFLLKAGDYLDEWTRDRSRKMLVRGFQVADDYAWVRVGNGERMVMTSRIKEGDTVIVRTGSRIPVDGIVIEGEAMVNQSSMTGESLPVMKKEGITVYAGTAVEEGSLAIKTLKAEDETRVARIVKVIEESEGLKAEVQTHAERLADRIVPYSFLLSGLTYALTGNPVRAASVLLIDYSCAIKLSTPLAVMAGMMRAARKGAVIKGGKFIERLSKADIFVLDKTGTLTEASPKVVDVIPFNGYTRDYILRHVACVEEHFPHPFATAVLEKARDEGLLHEEEHGVVEYIAAHGIASKLHGRRILVGSRHFISEDEGIDVEPAEPIIRDLASQGCSSLYVAIDDKLAGIVAIEDPLRDEARRFIQALKESGVQRVVLLTGDNEATARNVAEKLKIEEYYSQVFPDKKAEMIKGLKDKGHVVAMVGDGINDSPALSHADVGISMKHGADIAKEACDILLLDGSLMAIVDARSLSQETMSLIKQNFRYIIGINSALIGLALSGSMAPALSAFMHNATTVMVSLNSLKSLSGQGLFERRGV